MGQAALDRYGCTASKESDKTRLHFSSYCYQESQNDELVIINIIKQLSSIKAPGLNREAELKLNSLPITTPTPPETMMSLLEVR
jgi:hypothetical protein